MSIVLDGTAGITTPEITSAGGPLVVNASAPDNSVVVDASGNVGVGATPQTQSTGKALEVGRAGNGLASWFNNNNVVANMYYDSADKFAGTGFALQYYQDASNGVHVWRRSSASGSAGGTASMSESMRIDSSGNLLVGTTSASFSAKQYVVSAFNGIAAKTTAAADTYEAIVAARNGNNGKVATWWYSDITQVGSVSVTASATAYNTSSDYRLKHDIQPMTGALARVAALKPVTYKWNVDDSNGEGFIAHELQEICPDAVTGEKDAVDAEGNPQYQGIDTSFLVATLTAAIQEQQALIESLTARVVALDARLISLEGQAT